MGDFGYQTHFSNFSNDFGHLEDNRNYKGYRFEIKVCKREFETIQNIRYDCNPSAYSDWLRNHSRNSFDGTVTYSNGDSERIELKFVSDGVKIESSWFRRDWLTRDASLIVTNNPTSISYRDKRLAEREGKKILSVSEAKVYFSKQAYKITHPNQLSSWNCLIDTVITNIIEIYGQIIRKVTVYKFNFRLKSNLLALKSAMGARLSECHLSGSLSKVTTSNGVKEYAG